ncbi:MAG: sulfotransferase [Myxococcales bacterium]|nr:sulfotransferase [Myxococcales bacterium]
MRTLRHAMTALRLRVVSPVVRARGAILRRVRPAPAAVANEALDRVPILIVGCHRSGTSLLRRCVDAHSRIACPGETMFLEPLGAMVGVPRADEGFATIGVDLDEVREETAGRVRGWFEAYARSRGKPRWADKSPNIANQIDGVDLLLGREARFVLIVRDGMDVATSLGRSEPLWWQLEPFVRIEPDPYVAAARYWVELNTRILAFRQAHPERCHTLRYVDLVREPERTLRGVFAFLGESWEPTVLDFNTAAHTGGLEDHHVRTTTTFEDNTGRHRQLPIELQRRMWAVVGPTMRQFGYEDRSY